MHMELLLTVDFARNFNLSLRPGHRTASLPVGLSNARQRPVTSLHEPWPMHHPRTAGGQPSDDRIPLVL